MKTFGFILYLIFEIALPLAIAAFVMVSARFAFLYYNWEGVALNLNIACLLSLIFIFWRAAYLIAGAVSKKPR